MVTLLSTVVEDGFERSIFMLLEYLLSTTSIIFCGRLGQPEMAAAGMAQSIISIFCFMPGYGMVTVCNTYFSSGAGSKDEYKQGVILQKALILSGLVTLFCWPILINTDGMLRLFQQDPEITITVVASIANIVPILVIFEISDLTSNVAKGALQGCGRQGAGALIAFISYYFIGLPVCVYLVMFRRMKAMGMWIGLCLGNGSQAICLFTYTLTIDWDREATLSQERLSIIKSEALDGNLNELKSKEDMFLEMETGREISEKVPLVQESGKGFELSRATIYIRVINFAMAGIALLVGIAIFFTSY
ncbi:multidrug and toxin extrusion protein 1-like [Anneissia japonica]|uniref:multidrug and toxin extrusion protein 1-like n=1 Tax=Anneissia japonica TaxID=1529436 RepID=UPI0014256E60|nr:multidrug and toxin extrusion protein 1-like [Anneissia japonica]